MFNSFKDDCKKIITLIDSYPSLSERRELSHIEGAIVILEDKRFFSHPGFDLLSIIRVLVRRFQGNKTAGGASTIEQQLVRTITNRKELNLRRKLREILLAAIVTCLYDKKRILRVYAEIAFFGAHLHGANSAAKRFFKKDASHLSPAEANFIAALLKYPAPKHPTYNWKRKVARRSLYAQTLLSPSPFEIPNT